MNCVTDRKEYISRVSFICLLRVTLGSIKLEQFVVSEDLLEFVEEMDLDVGNSESKFVCSLSVI